LYDTTYRYETKLIELMPGEEERLGCMEFITWDFSTNSNQNHKVIYECTGQKHIGN
jgi:hypothetical protein